MKEVRVNGARIFYRDEGNGDPVLLVHGWTGSSYDWNKLIPLAVKNRRVVAPDQVGFGKSEKPRMRYDLGTMVGSLKGFVDAVSLDKFHLVGNSMGGQIAAAFALEHPERVKSICLLDAAGVTRGSPAVLKLGRFIKAVNLLLRLTPFVLYDFYYRRFGPYYDSSFLTEKDVKGHYHSYGNPDGAFAAASALNALLNNPEARLDTRLGSLKIPALIVWGENDPHLPLAMGREYHRLIPGSRLEIIPSCGHCPQEEKPEALLEILEGFWPR